MNVLTSILLICAAGLSLAWLVAAQRRLVVDAARRFVALPRVEQVLVVFAVCILTVCAQKQRTENSEQLTDVVAEASGSNFSACTVETRSVSEGTFAVGEPEGRTSGCENGDLRTETRSSSQISATSDTSKLRAKTALTSSSTNPGESVKSVDKNLPRVTTNDVARGYALVEVRTNETASYEMPTNGVVVGTWGKTGAYRDVVWVGLSTDYTDFHGFVWGDEVITSLWAHTWGKVRSRIRDRAHEIVAVGTPMSCVAGEGRLWTAATTNGTWVITWEKFVVGRRKREIIELPNNRIIESAEASAFGSVISHGVTETRSGEIIELSNNRIIESAEASASGSDDSCGAAEKAEGETDAPQAEEESLSNHNSIIRTFDYSIIDSISAQIELFPNGDFITRSNNVERVYRRVNPDDWDDDGIANGEDDEPMIAAEETQFGPNQTLPDGANSNAYCWVEVVVPQANATLVFNAEISEFGRRGA